MVSYRVGQCHKLYNNTKYHLMRNVVQYHRMTDSSMSSDGTRSCPPKLKLPLSVLASKPFPSSFLLIQLCFQMMTCFAPDCVGTALRLLQTLGPCVGLTRIDKLPDLLITQHRSNGIVGKNSTEANVILRRLTYHPVVCWLAVLDSELYVTPDMLTSLRRFDSLSAAGKPLHFGRGTPRLCGHQRAREIAANA